jgi:hypothetical protein
MIARSRHASMKPRKPADRACGRGTANWPFVLLLFAVALAGCQSGRYSYYTSPRVTGRVIAADTGQPLDRATVQRVVPPPYAGADTPPKGGQLMMQPGGVRTDADGRFVLDGERVVALFHQGGWTSVAVSFTHAGYTGFQTNYTTTEPRERWPDGVPWVNAGDIVLQPLPQSPSQ